MNCFKCATPLPDGARFCGICGTDVSGEHGHEKTQPIDRSGDAELMARLQAEVGTEYVIERELGRGGMAIVYLGHDKQLGRKVAVKLLPPELTFGSGGTVIERFRREARTSATLDHPNIIPVYRVSQSERLFWYVMKFLDGEPLDKILEREGQLALERCVDIIRQTGDALDHAHHSKVIHRDVKPANIIVDGKGRITVTDFGIAKALDVNTLTATGSMIGTPYFMSPEQCSGLRVGPASDQYSLGVMAYLMFGGHLPFTGDSAFDIVRKHVMEPVPPLEVLRPTLGKAVVEVVERALAKQPEERFASCGEFATALAVAAQPALAAVTPATTPPSRPARISETVRVDRLPRTPRPAERADVGRRKLSRFWGGTAIVVAVVGTALVVWQPSGPTGSVEQRTTPFVAAPVPIQPTSQAADSEPTGSVSQPLPTQAEVKLPAPSTPAPVSRPSSQQKSQGASPSTIPPRATLESQPVARPADSTVAAPARITVGSSPPSAMTINGRAVPTNPVRNFEVAAGNVTIVFTVTDSTGVWSVTRQFQALPGESKNLGRIALTRP